MTAAVARMLDQPVLWWQAVGLFVEHFAGWEPLWQDSIGDFAREQKRVHALRSAAANVGAMALAEVAANLEDHLLRCITGVAVAVPDDLRMHLLESFRQTWLTAAHAWKDDVPGSGRSN